MFKFIFFKPTYKLLSKLKVTFFSIKWTHYYTKVTQKLEFFIYNHKIWRFQINLLKLITKQVKSCLTHFLQIPLWEFFASASRLPACIDAAFSISASSRSITANSGNSSQNCLSRKLNSRDRRANTRFSASDVLSEPRVGEFSKMIIFRNKNN